MKIIRILIAYVLIAGVTHLGAMELAAMELSARNDKDIDQLTLDMLPDDVITKIAAYCDPALRNVLMYVCKNLDRLASKKNANNLLMHPLILGKKDCGHYCRRYMFISCIKGNYDLVCNLLENDANPNFYDDLLGARPLCLAEHNKHDKVAALLRDYGAIKIIKSEMPSAFVQAVYCNEIDSVKKYLSEGVNSNDLSIREYTGVSPLDIAIDRGYTDMVELLLEHPDVQVNLQKINGRTVLMEAVDRGHANIVKLLLKHPAIRVNLQDVTGATALIMAAREGHSDIIKSLLEHPDIQVDIGTTFSGLTALDIARNNNHGKTITLLQACIKHSDAKRQRQSGSGIEEDNYARLTWCVLL